MGGKDTKDMNDSQRQPERSVDITEYMFTLFCKIQKILTRGIKAVAWIDRVKDLQQLHQQQPNRNKDHNDNPRTIMID